MNKQFIDLSVLYADNMPVWPGDRSASLTQYKTFEKDYHSNYWLETGMHVGTHIECSGHMLDNKVLLTHYPLERFCGKAVLFDVRGKREIMPNDIDVSLINGATVALLWTGHDVTWKSDDYYFTYPVLSREAATQLLDHGIKIIALDTPSPDESTSCDVHKAIFSRDGFIIENLTNLKSLQGIADIIIYAFPLKVETDASIVRVVAQV